MNYAFSEGRERKCGVWMYEKPIKSESKQEMQNRREKKNSTSQRLEREMGTYDTILKKK